jgi:hypothetical protein
VERKRGRRSGDRVWVLTCTRRCRRSTSRSTGSGPCPPPLVLDRSSTRKIPKAFQNEIRTNSPISRRIRGPRRGKSEDLRGRRRGTNLERGGGGWCEWSGGDEQRSGEEEVGAGMGSEERVCLFKTEPGGRGRRCGDGRSGWRGADRAR